MELEKKIVLITGSNGRIGPSVMERLTGHFSDVAKTGLEICSNQ